MSKKKVSEITALESFSYFSVYTESLILSNIFVSGTVVSCVSFSFQPKDP